MERRPLTICAIGSSSSTHVVSRVKCFADRGHRVFLICDSRAGIEGVTELVPSGRPIRGLRSLSLLLSVPGLIRRCRPDVVHVHFAYSPLAWMAAAANRHPLVVSVEGRATPGADFWVGTLPLVAECTPPSGATGEAVTLESPRHDEVICVPSPHAACTGRAHPSASRTPWRGCKSRRGRRPGRVAGHGASDVTRPGDGGHARDPRPRARNPISLSPRTPSIPHFRPRGR